MKKSVVRQPYAGTISVPPSKSDAQRALLCAALATGRSVISGIGESADVLHMLETVQRLGAGVERHGNEYHIQGRTHDAKPFEVHVGESGLGIRLLTTVCTAISPKAIVSGEGSLEKRDLGFFERTLPQMGVDVQLTGKSVPVHTTGLLRGGRYQVDGSLSSQYISGLLMALPLCKEDSELQVLNLKSTAYVHMTLAVLKQFGIDIEETSAHTWFIRGNQSYESCTYEVEGDWSAASNWLVAAALGFPVKVAGLSMSSKQADKSILSMLLHAKCRITTSDQGILIDGTDRKPLEVDATDCPDLFPALTAYGALTEGHTRIAGVHRLANKESDRGEVLVEEFTKLGVNIRIEGDELCIDGQTAIHGGQTHSHNDHRIAMCLAIVGMTATEPVEIESSEAVAKSYPDFWKHLEELAKV